MLADDNVKDKKPSTEFLLGISSKVFLSGSCDYRCLMQGIIESSDGKMPDISTSLRAVTNSFADFWKKDANMSASALLSYYGPIGSTILVATALTVAGLFSSCLGCYPIRLLFLAAYVYVLTIVLLYKKSKAYCPDEKPVEDLSILAIWPSLLFIIAYLAPALMLLVIPGLALLSFVPVVSTVVSCALACSVYGIALPYSQFLLLKRTCERKDIRNVWTFNN